MYKSFKKISHIMSGFGFNPLRFLVAAVGIPIYIHNYFLFKKKNKGRWHVSFMPMLGDRYSQSGIAGGHYFSMDLWAARLVYKLKPKKIADVGSRIDGFVAHILSFREIEVFDIRPLISKVDGLKFRQIDITKKEITEIEDRFDCVTSLHALEHFGLGRYGDKINVDGWRDGILNLIDLLEIGGSLIIALPVGRERVEFDAHRVFDASNIYSLIVSCGFHLESYSVVDDDGIFHENSTIGDSINYEYGCGCFHFIKSKPDFIT